MSQERLNPTGEQTPGFTDNEVLREFVGHAEDGRVTYRELCEFLEMPLEPREQGRAMPLIYSAALFASSVALSSTVEIHRDHIPEFGILPKGANTILNQMYSIYPFGSGESSSAALRDHVPRLYLGGAITLAALEFWRLFNERRNDRNLHLHANELQHKLAIQEERGEVRWQIIDGATVAFVGAGDRLTQDLARNRTGGVIQIGFEKPEEGAWVNLQKDTTYGAILEALDKADFGNAGELLIMPIKKLDVFLPSEGDHDISLDRTVNYIKAAVEYCDQNSIPRKPVLVVGNKHQTETYVTSEDADGIDCIETKVTLEERLNQLAHKLNCDIEIIDPTEVILSRIAEIAGNRKILFTATKGSQEMYRNLFFSQYSKYAQTVDPNLPPIKVTYNNNDWPTAGSTEHCDIAVLIDSTQHPRLSRNGAEHVLVVSELTMDAASKIIEPEM